jgi:hypothetical protein
MRPRRINHEQQRHPAFSACPGGFAARGLLPDFKVVMAFNDAADHCYLSPAGLAPVFHPEGQLSNVKWHRLLRFIPSYAN